MLFRKVPNTTIVLSRLFVIAFCLSDISLMKAQQRPGVTPACGPNNTIPAGYSSCRTANGSVVVGPPPSLGTRGGTVYVAPPTGTRQGGTVYVPPPPPANTRPATNPTSTQPTKDTQPTTDRNQDREQSQPRQTKQQSVWTNAAWITAFALLIGAFAKLVSALRRKSSSD